MGGGALPWLRMSILAGNRGDGADAWLPWFLEGCGPGCTLSETPMLPRPCWGPQQEQTALREGHAGVGARCTVAPRMLLFGSRSLCHYVGGKPPVWSLHVLPVSEWLSWGPPVPSRVPKLGPDCPRLGAVGAGSPVKERHPAMRGPTLHPVPPARPLSPKTLNWNKQVQVSSSYSFSFISLTCVHRSHFFPRVALKVFGVFTETFGDDAFVTRNLTLVY